MKNIRKEEMIKNCKCESCQNACRGRPGWFKPEQIKSLLKYFKVKTIKGLLGKNKLAIDWWNDSPKDVLVLAPNLEENDDIQYPKNPQGECVFFKKGKCSIYKIRPFECREYIHTDKQNKLELRHKAVMKTWKESTLLDKYQDKVCCPDMNIFDPFNIFG